jgi:hypothetical protein
MIIFGLKKSNGAVQCTLKGMSHEIKLSFDDSAV